MKINQLIFVLLVQLFSISTAVSPIPLKCWLWDSPCLKVKAQAISSILAAGIPDLDVQPLDTVLIDYIHIDHEGFRADFRSMSVRGMSDAVVDNINVDMPTKTVNLVLHSNFATKSRYIANGTLLSTPIDGDGDFFMNLDNVQLAMRIPYDIIKDAYDNEVMLLKSFDYTYDVKNGAQYHLKTFTTVIKF